ncbi:peptidyl-prolyl cis-trans isomerase, partial [Hoeflea sp.]|uniref:peptidyl-prolyl cis-trans isomerase n=1 Tax=Hoeflea sp. TaxID=1940281 RepID=UPI0019C0A09E
MLNAMREGAKSGFLKFILFGLMVMAVGGLVLMDVGGFFRVGVAQTSVAEIEGDELSIVTFDRSLRRILANQGLDAQTAYRLGFISQVLGSEINNNLLQRYASDMGLRVGDEVVLKQVSQLIEPFVTEGVDRKTALNNILRSQGMSEREFIRMIKAQMTNTLLTNAVQIGTEVAPDTEARDIYQYRNEGRTVRAIYLPHSGIEEVQEPTEEILLSFYQAGQERYAISETRTFTVATLNQEQLAKTLDISEEELRAIYERDIAAYSLPERRVLEQAIIDNQATATAIVNRMSEGGDLKSAVAAETGSEDAYLGEETFEQEGLLEDVAAPVFAADKGAVVGPVESALGWHVIRVADIVEPETRPFEDVRDELRQELVEVRVMDEMFALANAIDDALAGGAPLEEVAENMGLNLKQYGPIKEDGSTPDNKDGVKDFGPDWGLMTETVFELLEGEVSPVMELADGRYAAIRVD